MEVTLEKYQEINDSFKGKSLVFHIGSDAGFYSELNNMILAIIYCLRWNIRFTLYSADANFKHNNGWTDYFLPFCEEITDDFHVYGMKNYMSVKGMLFERKKVKEKLKKLIKENDIISVRGLGRVIYNRQISVTKKGKNLVSVSIYC